MFNWFGKKKAKTLHKNLVWQSVTDKLAALPGLINEATNPIVYSWFHDTTVAVQDMLDKKQLAIKVQDARSFTEASVNGRTIILLESYPLQTKELPITTCSSAKEIWIISSLDEPLFTHFGGEKVLNMMKQMGMQPSESISHPLITQSITRAQQKIAEKVVIDFNAQSQAHWFKQYNGLGYNP